MTGFNSKRKVAQDKVNDEADTLTIVYQRGFADGKRSAERKPLTDEQIMDLCAKQWASHPIEVARAIEAAHGIKEQP